MWLRLHVLSGGLRGLGTDIARLTKNQSIELIFWRLIKAPQTSVRSQRFLKVRGVARGPSPFQGT